MEAIFLANILDYPRIVSALPFISGQLWFVEALLHFCGNPSFPPQPGSFIRKDFSAKTEKIFLGRKLVKAVISSEDNQTMGNFHREAKRRFSRGIKVGKNRPTSLYLESSNMRIGEKRFQWGVCSESRMWSVEEKLGSEKLHFLFKSCTDYRQKPWQLETYQYTQNIQTQIRKSTKVSDPRSKVDYRQQPASTAGKSGLVG